MPKIVFTAIAALALVACQKKKAPPSLSTIEQYYAGHWQIEVNSMATDTSFVLLINKEGNFAHQEEISGTPSQLTGSVIETGVLRGEISVNDNKVGDTGRQAGD
ncbi:MAG: hypothetical protein U5L96_21715 [Owenweeksia sp.]|nr:hypothetical protein [Owenweeksia sp.]